MKHYSVLRGQKSIRFISKVLMTSLLIFVLLLSSLPVSAAAEMSPSANLQPLLSEIAREEPNRPVRVIVQKSIQDSTLEDLTAGLGGTVVADLHIINAFVAELPAHAAIELAQSDGVRWISLDAPVVKQSNTIDTDLAARDDFELSTYAANAGTLAWQGSWTEIGESDGPQLGDVSIVRFMAGDANGIRIQNNQKGIMRGADLSNAAAAQLIIHYRRKGFQTEADYVMVEASPDNGQTWFILGQISGSSTDDDIKLNTYDLTSHATSQTAIRLVSAPNMGGQAKFYLDSVEINVVQKPEQQDNLQPNLYLPVIEASISAEQFNANSVQHTTLQSTSVSAADLSGEIWVTRDEFNSNAYNNNNGSGVWSSPWIEINDDNSADYGDVRVRRNQLEIRDDNKQIMRSIDLSGASKATLSFGYQRVSFDDINDYVALEILAEGNGTWKELARFTGRASDTSINTVEYDISEHLSKGTTIRFVTSDSLGSLDKFYIDNVQIVHDGLPISAEVNGGTTYRVEANSDTYIYELSPTRNYGDEEDLRLNYSTGGFGRHILMKYDVPSELMGCTVATARAYFYDGDPDPNYVGIYRITSDWVENAVTWNSAPTYHPVPDATFMIEHSSETPHIVDITSIAQEWLNGSPNYGIMLQSLGDFGTSEHIYAHEANLEERPYLELDAICAAGVSIGVPSLTEEVLDGNGIGVAVVDSGIAEHDDFLNANGKSRIVHRVQINKSGTDDSYGHGTHVAGIIGGTGAKSNGAYKGIASAVDLIDVKVTDDFGFGSTSDVIAGLQWILENREQYNIRVANLSLNSTVAESYHRSPLNAALEILWFKGIVVVVSSGNNGSGPIYPPANDPFVITVGAVDDKGTPNVNDDSIAPFSAYGFTVDGFLKPDIVAPGTDIIGPLSGDDSNLVIAHPAHRVTGAQGSQYFRMSGTSMASGVVAGSVALLLQHEPNLTPDQVKYRLMATAMTNWAGYKLGQSGAGYLDIHAAIQASTMESANIGITVSRLLFTLLDVVTLNSVNWNSVNWNSVNWNSVNWNSVNWNSVSWDD